MIKKLLSIAAMAAMVLTAGAETLDLPLNEDSSLGSGWGSSYDGATQTITYESAWSGRGWWVSPADYSAYDEVVIEFEPVEFLVQTVIEYNGPDGKVSDAPTPGAAGATKIVAPLNNDYKSNVMQIYLQSSSEGTVKLKAAYLQNAAKVDTDKDRVLWEGDKEIDWWDNAIKVTPAEFKSAKISAGEALTVYYTAGAGAGIKIQYLLADWSQAIVPGFSKIEGFNEEYGTVGLPEGTGTLSFVLSEEDVTGMTDAAANQAVMFVGQAVTLTKITVGPAKTDALQSVALDLNAPVEYYNLQGVKVANPANGGIYIVRQGAKTSKVLVK